jgi:regulatory protein
MLGIDERLARPLELSYAYLNRRERTVGEVRGHLQQKGIAGDLIDASIRTLTDQGYLDDRRFAQMFVADKRALEHWGSERIRIRLQARGIDRDLAEAALLGGVDDGDPDTELERALEVLRRRYASAPRDRRERERALGVLLRRGYDSELALEALAAYARDA